MLVTAEHVRGQAGHRLLGVPDGVEVELQALPIGGAESRVLGERRQLLAHQVVDALAAIEQELRGPLALGGHAAAGGR